MNTFRLKPYLAPFAVLAYLCSFMLMPAANAGMIGTQTMLDQQTRAEQVAHVRDLLSQQRVEEQMIALGVDPADAQARVADLTNAELTRLEGHLESLPAGGSALAVLGIVFLVLIVLEVVGAIDLFNRL